jgi:hypothetical protein
MKRAGLFFIFLSIFACIRLLAADAAENPQSLEHRKYTFEKESLERVLTLTGNEEGELIEIVEQLVKNFTTLRDIENPQKLYDELAIATENFMQKCDVYHEIYSRSFATSVAYFHSSIKLRDNFMHGFMIEKEFVSSLLKMIFQ